MNKEEQLARRWMPGHRHGRKGTTPRAAWEHPQDLVNLIDQIPFGYLGDPRAQIVFQGTIRSLKAIAWLHDLLEDGVKENGERVTIADLTAEGIDTGIIADVESLSQRLDEEKTVYLQRLIGASMRAKIVKCIDRICNLREGLDTFKDARWARYTRETNDYIFPLVFDLPEVMQEWVRTELRKPLLARPA